MSEVDLHLIQGRLSCGLREAARRGDLRTRPPTGFTHDRDGHIVKVADEAIRATIGPISASSPSWAQPAR
jgi:DNA invertase Pin-like site-specific DNA recombinase